MPSANDISVTDFVNSMLKSAKKRGISCILVFGYRENGRAVMKMISTENEAATKGALAWLFKANPISATEPDSSAPAEPPDEPEKDN
jgi:hypothetical protein